MSEDLNIVRRELDEIDQRLVEALAARQQMVREAAGCKATSGEPIRDYEREREMLKRLGEQARQSGLNDHFVGMLYREILDQSVRYQTNCLAERDAAAPEHLVVAYQGAAGAYSHLAAMRHFSAHGAEVICQGRETFEAAFEAVKEGSADYALLPIENTTAGSINEVYDLLARRNLPVVGEEVLRVEHCLLAPEDVPLQRIERVLSHPQAVAQCSRFLTSLPNGTAEVFTDTAMAARKVKQDGDPTQAALASEEAARRYGLHVVARSVADQKENYTRFVIVAAEPAPCEPRVPCKTSLIFATSHERGALMQCLKVLDAQRVNLTKLESRPRPRAPWEYLFFADIEGRASDARIARALDALAAQAGYLKVLGTYPAHAVWQPALTKPAPPEPALLASERDGQAGTEPPRLAVREPEPAQAPPQAPPQPDKPYRLAQRALRPEGSTVRVGEVVIGGAQRVITGGPCSVESREQIRACAEAVRAAGGHLLRGGCFKPRTSPYAFQGLGLEGLALMAEAGAAFGLPIVTEVLSPADLEAVAGVADMLQIGARNMKNYALLKEVGQVDRPVLLKRGMMASVDEWLAAAEYVLAHGNQQVVLCERGIRTFETATRNTLDLTVLPVVRERTHLPVIVDPSHACGKRDWVPPLAEAAFPAGADGVMVEMHPDPENALSDGPQSLTFDGFEALAARLL